MTQLLAALPEETAPRRPAGRNLVALARPYFGLIVLTTGLLTALGMWAMLRMPSGIYPEVAFPRIVVITQSSGLEVKDVEVAVTRPIEEAVSIVLGVIRVRSKSVRGAAQLDVDFAPGTNMVQALNDVRARMAEVGSQLPAGTELDHRAANALGLSDHFVRRQWRPRSVGVARLCLLRFEPADQAGFPTSLTSRFKEATSARSWSRWSRRRWWPPACRSPRWPTASGANTA